MNMGKRFLFRGYNFSFSNGAPIFRGILGWWLLELLEGWRTWFTTTPRELRKAGGVSASGSLMSAILEEDSVEADSAASPASAEERAQPVLR
jgi:hypothetical protein